MHCAPGRVLSSRAERPFGPTIEMPFQLPNAGTIARSLIGVGVIALIFYFLGNSLASNWSDLKSEDIDVRPALLPVAGMFLAADILFRSFIWRDIVSHFTGREGPPLRRMAKIFVYSWIARYVPGKVGYVIGRFYLGRTVGLSSPALVGSMAYEMVLLVVASLMLSSLMLVPSLAIESQSVLVYLILLVVAVGGLVALQPPLLRRALRIVLRLLGREPTEAEWLLPPRRMAKVIALFVVSLCLSGTGFYLLIISLTPYSPRYLPLAVGAMTLAGIVGMISVFAPAGLGVREGLLVGVLQFTMPIELAVVISLVARVWATVVDLLLIGGCFLYDYVSGDRLLTAAIRGSRAAEAQAEPSGVPDL